MDLEKIDDRRQILQMLVESHESTQCTQSSRASTVSKKENVQHLFC